MDLKQSLSESQYKIVSLLINGLTIKDIAYKIGVSPPTVAKQLKTVYQKLKINNKTELLIQYGKPSIESPRELTPTELKVLQLTIEQDKSVLEISEELGITAGVVRTHLSHIYRKMGIKDRTELFKLKSESKSENNQKEIEEELQKAKSLYKEMEQLYKDLHTDWLNLKTEKWLLEETVRIRDREIAELKAKLDLK